MKIIYTVFLELAGQTREIEFSSLYEAFTFARSLAIMTEDSIRVLETTESQDYSIEYTVTMAP